MRLTIPWSAEFIQRISFFFSWHSLEFGLISYPKLCSCFFSEQKQLLMRLHPLRNTWQLFMRLQPVMNEWQLTMRLHPVMNERQLTYFHSLKNSPRVDFFGGLFLGTNHGRRFASPLTHTWLLESEALLRPYHLVMIERVGERETASLSIILLTTIVADGQRVAHPHPWFSKRIRVSYFLVTISTIFLH